MLRSLYDYGKTYLGYVSNYGTRMFKTEPTTSTPTTFDKVTVPMKVYYTSRNDLSDATVLEVPFTFEVREIDTMLLTRDWTRVAVLDISHPDFTIQTHHKGVFLTRIPSELIYRLHQNLSGIFIYKVDTFSMVGHYSLTYENDAYIMDWNYNHYVYYFQPRNTLTIKANKISYTFDYIELCRVKFDSTVYGYMEPIRSIYRRNLVL